MFKHRCLIVFFFLPILAFSDPKDDFTIANNLYKVGKYNEAIEYYEKIVNQNYFSFELYYNMGNTYFKLKNYPKAILYYEKAKKINSTDEELNHNLKLANTFIKDKVEEIPQLFISNFYSELVKSKKADDWAWLSIKLMFLALSGFLLFLFSSNYNLKKIGFYSAITIVLLSVLTVSFGFAQKKNEEDMSYAILMIPSCNVLASPDEKATRLFVIHEGIKLKINKKENDWIYIKLSNGNGGWIKASDVEII
jgi:tetratricopeptide (TPR) repeat protein